MGIADHVLPLGDLLSHKKWYHSIYGVKSASLSLEEELQNTEIQITNWLCLDCSVGFWLKGFHSNFGKNSKKNKTKIVILVLSPVWAIIYTK